MPITHIEVLNDKNSSYVKTGLPSGCRGGYNKLTSEQQIAADECALKALNTWLVMNGRQPIAMSQARGRTEMELY